MSEYLRITRASIAPSFNTDSLRVMRASIGAGLMTHELAPTPNGKNGHPNNDGHTGNDHKAFDPGELIRPVVALASFEVGDKIVDHNLQVEDREACPLKTELPVSYVLSGARNASRLGAALPRVVHDPNLVDLSRVGPDELLRLSGVIEVNPSVSSVSPNRRSKNHKTRPSVNGVEPSTRGRAMIAPLPATHLPNRRDDDAERHDRRADKMSPVAVVFSAFTVATAAAFIAGLVVRGDGRGEHPPPPVAPQSRSWEEVSPPQYPEFPREMILKQPDSGALVVILATVEPTELPTATPGVVPTSTALPPSCTTAVPGQMCEWPIQTATPSPIPVCETPLPGSRCTWPTPTSTPTVVPAGTEVAVVSPPILDNPS